MCQFTKGKNERLMRGKVKVRCMQRKYEDDLNVKGDNKLNCLLRGKMQSKKKR